MGIVKKAMPIVFFVYFQEHNDTNPQNDKQLSIFNYLAYFCAFQRENNLSFCLKYKARRAKAAHLPKGGCRLRLRGLKQSPQGP